MDADADPAKMAELYYAIRKEAQQKGGDNEKSNYRGRRHRHRRAGGGGRDGGHGPGGAPGPADPARGDGGLDELYAAPSWQEAEWHDRRMGRAPVGRGDVCPDPDPWLG